MQNFANFIAMGFWGNFVRLLSGRKRTKSKATKQKRLTSSSPKKKS